MRNETRNRGRDCLSQRGVATVYLLLLTLVILGFLVMAVDVGRLYLIQGELQTAADAAALAAARQLVGAAELATQAGNQVTASFAAGNDNRFNLGLNPICEFCSSLTTIAVSYFSTLADARANTGGPDSGADSKYVRVQITAPAPVVFGPLLNGDFAMPMVTAAAIAGISAPMCTASGIDGLAVVALNPDENIDYGFSPASFYTLSWTTSQAALPNTDATAQYVILDHLPNGLQGLDLDSSLFELGAGGISGNIAVDNGEIAFPNPNVDAVLQGSTNTAGQDILCGLNVRFGVNPADNVCTNIASGAFAEVLVQAPSLSRADTDLGGGETAGDNGLQLFATGYGGNLRRVLTMAIVDAGDPRMVLNFRQFLIEPAGAGTQGLDPSLTSGAFRAQYIGAPVPLRSGAIGGSCSVSSGVGRIVLH